MIPTRVFNHVLCLAFVYILLRLYVCSHRFVIQEGCVLWVPGCFQICYIGQFLNSFIIQIYLKILEFTQPTGSLSLASLIYLWRKPGPGNSSNTCCNNFIFHTWWLHLYYSAGNTTRCYMAWHSNHKTIQPEAF